MGEYLISAIDKTIEVLEQNNLKETICWTCEHEIEVDFELTDRCPKCGSYIGEQENE